MILRKWGTAPHHVTKFDIQKTRDIKEYTSNDVPMQSDKLKIRLIKEGYLEPKCYSCGRDRWLEKEIALQLNHKDGEKNNNNLENQSFISLLIVP